MDWSGKYIVFIQVLFWIQCSSAFKSHYGTEFYLGMIPNYGGNQPNITLDIASEVPGVVQLFVPFLGINSTQSLRKGLTSLTVDHTLVQRGNFQANRSFLINITVPVAVYVTSFASTIPETYMALPKTSVGNTYMVASYRPYDNSSEKSVSMIISNFVNTKVNISQGGQVHLNKMEVLQTSNGSDLTGTIVTSTKPVSVISGTSCAQIPFGVPGCDLIVEQMVPVNAWTNTYIVSPLPPKTGYLVRVLAVDAMQVCLSNSSQHICKHMPQKSSELFQFGLEATVIYSNVSFGVVQYGVGYSFDDTKTGDPFMSVIPGLKNYISQYYFAVPSVYSSFKNFLIVTVKTTEKDSLTLDGMPVNYIYNYTVSKPLDEYVILVANISSGFHTLAHRSKYIEFGALLYGLLVNTGAGYGFPAGMKYPNATSDVDPTRTRQQKCYHCDEMTSLEVCDAVHTCSEKEVCYAERFSTRSGTFYRSGCIDKNNCPNRNTTTSNGVCLECCHGNYCNNKGCGDDNFPDRDERGPMCYDCQHVLNDTDLCMKVTLCGIDEVCSIEKYKWGNDYHYKMGCTHRLCTPMKRSLLPKRLRRSTPLCSTCCSDDFCNSNCTKTTDGSTIQIIVG